MKKNIEKIKTSNKKWFKKAMQCYKEKKEFIFIDDANIGVTKKDLSSGINLIKNTYNTGSLTWQQISAALTSIGITSAGVYLIILAIADPEPTSKLGLLISGGVTLALTGSLGAIYSLIGITFIVTGKGGPNGGELIVKPVTK